MHQHWPTTRCECIQYLKMLAGPVSARSKACVYGRSLAGNVSLNPVRGMDVCLL
jgi:hypothetical protein